MLRFSANLSFQFLELPFLERFKAAKDCHFKAVEYMFAYDHQPNEIAQVLKETNLELVLFNAPPGDLKGGEVGLAALPHRKNEFRDSIETVLSYATKLQCKRIHVLSGIVPSTEHYSLYFETCVENLRYAAKKFASFGITLMIEPLNKGLIPGYLIEKIGQAKEMIEAVNEKNVALQFDIYHIQLTEGNITNRYMENFKLIQHIQIAGVPDRHEPDLGEINYRYLFEIIEKSGYNGWIGCEYLPKTTTQEGLGWLNLI